MSTMIDRVLERPLNQDRLSVRDHAQCFLFWITCVGPMIRATIGYIRRNLPPMFHTPMGFKAANEERVAIYRRIA